MSQTTEGTSNTAEIGEDGASPATRLLAWVDRHRRWVFAGIVVLYLAGFTGRWRVSPDNALYMSLGRSLAQGQGFVYHGERHNWFEPGLPLVIAASYRLFGVDNYAPILAFVLLCSLAALALTYRLMLRHAGRPTAVLVTALMGATESCLRYGFQIVSDTPFLVALLAYLLAYERLVGKPLASPAGITTTGDDGRRQPRPDWLAWGLLPAAMTLMVTFRPTSITFVGAVGLATAWHLLRGPNRVRHVLIGLLTLACFLGFRAVDPRRGGAGEAVAREQRLRDLLTTQRGYFVNNILTVTAPDFVEEILPEAIFGAELGPGVDTAVSLAVIAAGLALFRRRVLWGAWVAATFFQCAVWLPRERYLLQILPLLLYGLWRGAAWLTSRPAWAPPAARVVLAALLLLHLGPNLVYDVKFLVEQRRVGIDRHGNGDPAVAPFRKMAEHIEAAVGEHDVVFATEHRELSYFSGRRVEGSPWSFRWRRTSAEERAFFERIGRVPALYAVLPDTTKEPHVAELIGRLGMRPGAAVATVERPPDRKGKAEPRLTLYRLEAGATSAPTTPAGSPRSDGPSE